MKLTWHNERRKISDLIPYEQNPRQLTEKQAKNLTKSLTKFDLVEVPAIDVDNKIVAGHQRCAILKTLNRGDEEIDVRVPNRKLTEKEFQEYNLRSNKNTGEWDMNILVNFDVELLKDVGFDDSFLKSTKEEPIINNELYQQKFSIIIECDSEEQQQFLYDQFVKQELKCKILSI